MPTYDDYKKDNMTDLDRHLEQTRLAIRNRPEN
jgi:hypothetical protein